jgi:D-alanine-D-alanine ligase
MQILVLHNAVPPDAPPEDRDTLVQVDSIAGALERLGHTPETLACELDLAALRDQLAQRRPELVFNLVESLAGADSLIYLPPALLDALGVPYCGCRTESLFLTTHKTLAKERMRQAGLPTPDWVEHPLTDLRSLSVSSWIIKGIWDEGSRGMDDDAVVRDVSPAELAGRLARRAEQSGGPCFAEQFIDGREFNLALLAGPTGPEMLPPAEIVFDDFPPDKLRIVGYRAKWQEDSFEYHHTQPRFDFPAADAPLVEELEDLARRCWTLFRLRGWARVDFRVDAAGRPWILEVNGNPCLSLDAGVAAALQRAAIPFDECIRRIVEDAFV